MDATVRNAQPDRVGRFGWSLVLVCACGPSIAVDPAQDGDSAGGTAGDEASTAGVPGTSTQGGGNDESSGSVGSESTGAPPPVEGLCGRLDHEPIAVVTTDASASLLLGDTSQVALTLAGASVPADAHTDFRGAIVGSTVALTRSWTVVDSGVSHGADVGAFSAGGSLLWSRNEPNASVGPIYLGGDQTIAGTRSFDTGERDGVFYEANGDVSSLGEFTPRAARLANGLIPGHVQDANTPGWIDPLDLSVQLVSLPPENIAFAFEGDAIIYLTGDAVAFETPNDLQTTSIAGLGETHATSWAAPWLLLSTHDGAGWARVSPSAGTLEEIDLTPPAGTEILECYFLDAEIDRGGGVLAPIRDDFAAQIQRFDPTTGAWTALGERVALVDNMHAYPYGDTYVLEANGQNETFCPQQEWTDSAEPLVGHQTQIARPISGAHHLVEDSIYTAYANADGTCAAYAGFRTPSVILDVVTGETLDLAEPMGIFFASP